MQQMLLIIATGVVLVYSGICALLYVNQRGVMYYPQYTRIDAASTDFKIDQQGIELYGWVLNSGEPDPILYFGGNAERIEFNRDDFRNWFKGHSVYLVAYRGYGASEGQPSEQALFEDALAIFDDVQARHPEQPIAVIGRSLGSGVASYLASRRPVAKLALITPFDSMVAVAQSHYSWLPVRWLAKDRYESVNYLSSYHGPVLIIRAGNDEIIPAINTARLIAALPKAPRLIELATADHNDIGSELRYGRALAEFME